MSAPCRRLGNGVAFWFHSPGPGERHFTGLSQSTVSGHLAILQKAGLVTVQRVGQWNFFKRNEEVILQFIEHERNTL